MPRISSDENYMYLFDIQNLHDFVKVNEKLNEWLGRIDST